MLKYGAAIAAFFCICFFGKVTILFIKKKAFPMEKNNRTTKRNSLQITEIDVNT